MGPLFQNFTTQISEKFNKETPKTLHQESSKRGYGKAALTALTTFSILGATLYYRNSFLKFNAPDSSNASSAGTVFKTFLALTAFTGLGFFAYVSRSKIHAKYIDLSKQLFYPNISTEKFNSKISNLIKDFKNILYADNINPDELSTILDILNPLTNGTEALRLKLFDNFFPDIIPNGLCEMTKKKINSEDSKDRKLVEDSCQLVYQALTQQMKILLLDASDSETKHQALERILNLLTPFEKDDFRLNPNFYVNFIQHSPEQTWEFVQKYIFEYVYNNDIVNNIDSSPGMIVAKILNARDKSLRKYTCQDGLDILKKIVNGAKLSLFLNASSKWAASFAIRLMQHKLKIDPQKFKDLYSKDSETLKKLYTDLCKTEKIADFANFSKEKNLSHHSAQIANELIDERKTTFLTDYLLGSDATKVRETFLSILEPLSKQKSYSTRNLEDIEIICHFITSQILDPTTPQRTEMASLALEKYTHVFLNEKFVTLIMNAYTTTRSKENTALDSPCQNLLKAWNTSSKVNTEIKINAKISELTDDTKEKEIKINPDDLDKTNKIQENESNKTRLTIPDLTDHTKKGEEEVEANFNNPSLKNDTKETETQVPEKTNLSSNTKNTEIKTRPKIPNLPIKPTERTDQDLSLASSKNETDIKNSHLTDYSKENENLIEKTKKEITTDVNYNLNNNIIESETNMIPKTTNLSSTQAEIKTSDKNRDLNEEEINNISYSNNNIQKIEINRNPNAPKIISLNQEKEVTNNFDDPYLNNLIKEKKDLRPVSTIDNTKNEVPSNQLSIRYTPITRPPLQGQGNRNVQNNPNNQGQLNQRPRTNNFSFYK